MNVKQFERKNIVRNERWFLMRCNTFHRRMLIQRVVRRGLNHLRKRHNGKNDSAAGVTSGVRRTTGIIVPPLKRAVQANDQQMSQVMEQETLSCPMMMSPLRVKKSRSTVQRILKIELECVVFLLLLI